MGIIFEVLRIEYYMFALYGVVGGVHFGEEAQPSMYWTYQTNE